MINKKCIYCGKIIEGHTKKQIVYLMLQHVLARHPNKLVEYYNNEEKNDNN